MCKTNLFLRIFTFLLISVAIIFLNNYYLFIILFIYMLFLSVVDTNYKSLLLDFLILIILLLFKYTVVVKALIQILSILNMFYILLYSFSKKEKDYFTYKLNKNRRKEMFYRKNLDKVINNNKDKAIPIYGEKIILNNKVNKDLDKMYLYSKVRFYNYNDRISSPFDWNFTFYDFLFSTILLILVIILHIWW